MKKVNSKNINDFSEQNIKKLLGDLELELDLIDPKLIDWNKNYFQVHKNRYMSDLKIINKWYNGGKILEVGSIPCHLLYCLKGLGYPVTGLDINPDRSKKFIESHELDVKKCDIENEKIPFKSNSFDFILFNEIFEHLRIDPISALNEINRVLKLDKIMMLTTPNLYTLPNMISFFFGRSINDAYEEFEKIHTLGHMGHIREYSTKEVKRFLEHAGFEIMDVRYVQYGIDTYQPAVRPILYILYLCYLINPLWRPMQIIICCKKRE